MKAFDVYQITHAKAKKTKSQRKGLDRFGKIDCK
jgi:hypothetical protein